MTFLGLTGIINFISSISLGAYVLISNRRSLQNRSYFLFNLSIGVYSFGYFMWQLAKDSNGAFFWFQILFMGVILINMMYLQFVFTLLNMVKEKKNLLIFSAALNLIFIFMNFGTLFYSGLEPRYHFGFWPVPTFLFNGYLIFWHWSCFYGFYWLLKVWKSSAGIKREQIKYVAIACGIGYLGGATNWPMWYGIHFPPYFNIAITLYVAIIAYAIVKFRLMDINLAFRYATANSFLSVVIGTPIALAVWWVSHSVSATVISFFAPLTGHILFQKWKPGTTQAFVLAGKYAPHKDENIRGHKESIINSPTLRDWAENLCRSMVKLFDVQEAVVMVFDASHHYFASVAGTGLEQLSWGVPIIIENESPLAKMLEQKKIILIKEELQHLLRPRVYEAIQSEMESLSAELCVPFLMNEKLVGILAIGRKTSREMFNELDLKSMWKVGRGAEEALRALLLGLLQQQYSSEWAHDLLHPFGPKGSLHYVKAAVEGKYGTLEPKLKEKFEDIIEEMNFVEKYMDALLNPMKYIQSGVYNIRPRILTHYFDQAQRLYDEAAKDQGLQWTVRSPPHTIKVLGDAVIIFHRVIKNLLENAFRHTPSGGSIELGYRLEDKILVVFVKDTGPGIPKEKQQSIFERGIQGSDSNRGKAGLGLYNARKVMESHNGKLWVESDLGKGSSFYFTLPLAPPETPV